MITRKSVLQDIKHGGIYNDTLNNTSLTFVCGTCNNHCQKIESDPNLTFVKCNGAANEDTLNLTGTANVSVDANIGCNACIGNDACICNDVFIERCACVGCDLNVCNDATIENDLLVCNNATVNCDLTVCHDAEVCNDFIVDCNSCLKGTLDVDGAAKLNCTLEVDGTATFNGDVYIKGTTYDTHTEDMYVGADHITLREGAETGLAAQERAGIIIDHYNADGCSLGIVGDNTGTARVGEIEIVHVYTVDDTTYYSDRAMTTATTIPAGKQLFQIGDADPTTGEKEYYYVATDETEPIATRAECMCDHQLTCWNATGCDIETIGSLPSNNGAILQYDVTNCCYCHLENPGADGHLLTYDCACDKLKWNECGPTGNDQLLKWNDLTKKFEYLPVGNDGEVLTSCVSTPEYHWAVCAYNCGGGGNKYFEYPTAQFIDNKDGFESVPSSYACALFINFEDNLVIDQDMGSPRPATVYCLSDTVFRTRSANPIVSFGTYLCDITWEERQAMTCENPNWWELSQYAYKSLEPIEVPAQLVWKCSPSSYIFNTMADYTAVAATIPANSQVTILCEDNYTTSEQV